MDAVELMLPGGKPSRVWLCKCGRLHNRTYQPVGDGKGREYTPEERDEFARRAAERCCDWRCEVCGEKSWSDHQSLCRRHLDEHRAAAERELEATRFGKAAKVALADWDGSGMLYDAVCDRWHTDLDDAEEWYADDPERERPAYLWLSTPVDWKPDASGDVGDAMCDHFHEDAGDQISSADWKRLDEMVLAWWAEVGPTSYQPDFARCLLLPAAREGE